jgi:hypothetical protein
MGSLRSGGKLFVGGALTGLSLGAFTAASAQHSPRLPDFSSDQVGWIATNPDRGAGRPQRDAQRSGPSLRSKQRRGAADLPGRRSHQSQHQALGQGGHEAGMIHSGNEEVRHIYLDVPHSENPKPS